MFRFIFDNRNGYTCFGVFGEFLLPKKMDQRIRIKFYLKNEKCSFKFEMLTVGYGKSTMSKTELTSGREDVKDDNRPERTRTSTSDNNVKQVKKI